MAENNSKNNNNGDEGMKQSITVLTEVKKSIRGYEGVHYVTCADQGTNRPIVVGEVDPAKLRQQYNNNKENGRRTAELKMDKKKKENRGGREGNQKEEAKDEPKEEPQVKKFKERLTMEKKKSKNNNKGDEGENEVKQRITVIRTETKKAILGYRGVESVLHVEGNTNKQTVIREEHPSRFREAVENVQQASPLPKKDEKNDKEKKNGDGDAKEKKLKQKKSNELVQPQLTTAMLKVHSYCDCIGCTEKIEKVVTKTIGYHQMAIDGANANGQVTVKGSMDVNALAKSLERKLKRYVEIVPLSPQKEDEKKERSGDDHEEKDGGERQTGGESGLDDEKTEKSSGVESGQGGVGDTRKPAIIGKVNPVSLPTMVKQNKYINVCKISPLPEKDEDKNNNKEKGGGKEENEKKEAKDKSKEENFKDVLAESPKQHPYYSHAPQIFSDENPNSWCSIM